MASLVRKLEQFVRLSPVDHVILNRASTERVRHFAPRVDIVREGEKPKDGAKSPAKEATPPAAEKAEDKPAK